MAMDPETPLRIAVFHDLPSGGAKRTVHAQIRELVRRGHRVEAFLPSTAEEEFFPLREVADAVHVVEVPAQPHRERLLAGRPSPGDLLQWARLFHGIRRGQQKSAAQVDSRSFDVVVVHPSQFTQAPFFLRYSTTPSIYYCQEVLRAAHEPLITSPLMRLGIRATLGRMDKRNVGSANAIVSNSEYTTRRIREVYGRESTPVPPGVDALAFQPVEVDKVDYLLSVGAIHPLKGLELVVEALGRLPQGLRFPLVIVSDRHREKEKQRLLGLAEKLEVKLEIRSRIPEEELRVLYARARVVLCASHLEPLGLVPLEAMACGTPVVAVDEGGFQETILNGKTGFLVPREVGAFAKKLQWLLEHPAEAEEMGSEGRGEVISNWSWEVSMDRLIQVIRKVMGR